MKRDIITSATIFKQWCSRLRPVFALDTETTSLNYLDLEIIGWSICDGKQACYVDLLWPHVDRYKLLRILDYYIGEAEMVVFHNAPFDMMVLYKEGIIV